MEVTIAGIGFEGQKGDTRLLGRVTAVEFVEGQRVHKGRVLIRLDAQLIDNEIARHQKAIQAAREELDRIEHLDLLLNQEYQAAQAKAEAEKSIFLGRK